MTEQHVFGSDELNAAMLRGAQFTERDGMYDAAEVRTFLDRVASSFEVFLSQDAPAALRAEFARNAEIAQQVLDAGQNASEQLRRQAAEEARQLLEETREATLGLRQSLDVEIAQSRAQVEQMRDRLIEDLRSLYDRIGASLYRFERSAEEDEIRPIVEPHAPAAEQQVSHAPAPAYPVGDTAGPTPYEPYTAVEADPAAPAEVLAPAWQQLPAEAWEAPGPIEHPVDEAAQQAEPFAVHEDEPLAPGEPLVDLRELGMDPAQTGSAPQPTAEVGEGSWLEQAPPVEHAPEPIPEPVLEHDDALAEALIAGSPFGEESGPDEAPPTMNMSALAEEPSSVPPASAASPDAVAVRQLILDSLAQGQSREAIEAYLRDSMGFMEPAALVDAALTEAQ